MATRKKTGGRKKGSVNKQRPDVRALALGYTEECLRVLAGIMRDKDAPHVARVSATKELLDRGHGKSVQGVEVSGPDGNELVIRWQPS